MKRASYKCGIEYIALNDNAGEADTLEAQSLVGYISVGLLAALFDVPQERIAEDVVAYRKSRRCLYNPDVDLAGARNVFIKNVARYRVGGAR